MKKTQKILRTAISIILVLCMTLQLGILPASASVVDPDNESAFVQSDDWIWSSSTATINSVSYFRKAVELDKVPEKIEVKTSGHNFMKFYINGKLITGLSTPAPTSLPDNKGYLAYTFTGEKLTELLNATDARKIAFGGIVQYYGEAGLNYSTGAPGFWADIIVTYADKTTQEIKSGTDWSALKDTPFTNGTATQQPRKLSSVVDYDARKMPNETAWATYGYDEASYTAGTWTAAVPAAAQTKQWKLREQKIPEGKVHQVIKPALMGRQVAGTQVFDAGQIVSGFPRITISGVPAGTKITMRYSEALTGSGSNATVSNNISMGETSANYRDYYTFSGNGEETFCPDFAYKAFRYFQIDGLPNLITADDVVVEWASTGIDVTASFESSNDLLNKIYDACINTQFNNVQGMPVDCPHREQAQYLGDSQSQYDLLSYAFTDFSAINYKTLQDFATGQREDGRFDYITPSSQHDLVIPEYDLRYPDMLYQYYWYSGKTDALKEFYAAAVKNINYYYNGFKDPNGLIRKTNDWHISDWPEPRVDQSGKYLTVFNLHMYDALNNLSKIAQLIGKDGDAQIWADKAEALSAAINANLVDENGIYYDCSNSKKRIQGVTAYAIFVGQASPRFHEQQLDYIATMYNAASTSEPDTRVILTRVSMHVLLQAGEKYKQTVYNMIVKENGWEWGKMINMGYKTVWEDFGDRWSHSHAWTAFPAKMLLQYFTGVNYEGPNYSDVVIKPYLPDALSFLTGKVQAPVGDISTRIERVGAAVNLTVNIPGEQPVKVGVPRFELQNTKVSMGSDVLFADGQSVKNIEGVTYDSNDDQYIYFMVTPGTKTFTAEVAEAGTEESYRLKISATEGGTIKVNGEQISLPYNETVQNGTNITVEAVADAGMIFEGFKGTYASVNHSMSFTVNSNTVIDASFKVRTEKVYHTVSIDAPTGSGLTVKYKGETLDLPANLSVLDGTEITLEGGQTEEARYHFVAWAGDIFNANKIIKVKPDSNINLKVINEYTGIENLALGKTATDSGGSINNDNWGLKFLTDGRTTVESGVNGYTSGTFPNKILATPHKITVDLGKVRDFDRVVLYPRLDTVSADGETLCFPETYRVKVSTDGVTYDEGVLVEGRGNPMGQPQVVELGRTTGRYVQIEVSVAGLSADAFRVQLLELEVYKDVNLTADCNVSIGKTGNGTVKVNGQLKTLPFNESYPSGTHLVLEVVPGTDYQFTKFSGTLNTTDSPLYIEVKHDLDLNAEFISLTSAKSDNLANGKLVTANNAEPDNDQWKVSYLTDGLTTSTGTTAVDGKKGFTSKSYATKDCTENIPWVTIDLGANMDFNQIMLYPRTDVAGAAGAPESPNFPEQFDIQYRMQGDGADEWHDVKSYNDFINPQGNAAQLDFDLQNGRYIRISPKRLGSPAIDDVSGLQPYRFQLAEIEVYSSPKAGINLAANSTVNVSSGIGGGWTETNLIDGVLRSGGRNRGTPASTGSSGYSSAIHGTYTVNNGVLTDPISIAFAFGSSTTFNQMVIYPRSDIDGGVQGVDNAVTGKSGNFPVSYKIQVSDSGGGGDNEWTTVYERNDDPNPMLRPVVCHFEPVTAKHVRLYITKVGVPGVDEISKAQRVQLAEIRVENVTSEFQGLGSVSVSTKDNASTEINVGDTLGLVADVVNSSLPNNNLVWTLEDENGFVTDIANMVRTNGTTPELTADKAGSVYAVARLANGLGVYDKVLITINDTGPTPKVEAGIVDKDGNPVESPSFETNAPFTVSVTTPADVEYIKLVNENGMTIGKTVVSVTDNGNGTKTWILSLSVATAGAGRVLDIYTAGSDKEYSDTGAAVSFDIVGVAPAVISAVKTVAGSANVNEEFTITVETTKTIDKVKLSNETGNSIGVISKSFVIDGNKKIWTLTAKIGTKGDRIVTVYGAPKDTDYLEAGVSFNVTILKP